ncbi:MAG: sigma 54-interacting transcriptional regulator, partial [Deltaproteobacteria bacterium]|nr:sigma 54-interacting transcriptional regulator [Deltaproteobacteria bacterium]
LDEVLSMSVSDINPNLPIEKWNEHYREVKKKGSMRIETQQISGDGQTHDIEVSTNCLKFGDREFMCSFGRDITKRKQLEVKLKESEERFRAFMDNIPSSVYIKDENDKHIYGNPATLKSVEKKQEDFIGSTTRDLWPPQLAGRLIELDRKVIDEDNPRITEEWRNTEKGEIRWRRDIKFPIKLVSKKKLLGGIAIDITEIKQSEQKLRNAYKEIKQLKQRLEHENIYLREEIELRHRHEEIMGESEPVKEMLYRAEQVAEADATVLILGETGAGKELLARAIHNISARKARPMIKVNCAALPPTLIETELFGREKGAYTGALTKQKGRFELADGSTIFLDEISELSLELQPKLLRVLQEGHFERVGSSKTIAASVRIIAATNRDLSQAVLEGRFRKDLYYRLNVFPITVPPLRERQEDIPTLVWAFVKEFEKTMANRIKTIPRKSMEALQRYAWPGNVRELRNVIERAMIISKGKLLNIRLPALSDLVMEPEIKLVDVERKHILKILQNTGWRIKGQNGAARLLDLHPATLYSKMKRLEIHRPAQLG